MAIGKVKWFNNEKKYGFILTDDKEVFVHFSEIMKDGYKTLKKGQEVEFEIVQGPKGDIAKSVKPLYTPHLPPRTESRETNRLLFLKRALQAKHNHHPHRNN